MQFFGGSGLLTLSLLCSWLLGGLSGGGVQTQTVTCMQTQNSIQTAVVSSACTGTQPATQQACNTAACANNAQWQYGVFGVCSASCAGGTQTREAHCFSNGMAAQNSACIASAGQPIITQACNTADCQTMEVFQWEEGAWGTCSASCGGGTQTVSAERRHTNVR